MRITPKDMKLIRKALYEKVESLEDTPYELDPQYEDYVRLLETFDGLILQQ